MRTSCILLVSAILSTTDLALANDANTPAAKPTEPAQVAEPSAKDAKAEKSEQTTTVAASASEYSCTMDKVKRTVRVAYEKEGSKVPCKVNYVRDASTGEEKVLYSAAAQEGYCEQKAGEFVEKLKSTGWSCSTP